jgi:hypothetical protein
LSNRIVFLPKAPGIVQAWGAVSAVAIAYVHQLAIVMTEGALDAFRSLQAAASVEAGDAAAPGAAIWSAAAERMACWHPGHDSARRARLDPRLLATFSVLKSRDEVAALLPDAGIRHVAL